MIGTLIGSSIISAIFMVALVYLAIEKKINNNRILPLILLSSGVCAISLLTLIGNYFYELGIR